MAKSGERRMLFDIRGRRKHVVRVVYAILAVLMGASLFLVVGPVNIGGLLGGGSTRSSSAIFDEQAERIELRLAKSPHDAALLLSLARTRISAGNAQVEVNPETRSQTVTPAAEAEYETAVRAWSRYLKQGGGEPSAGAALLVANTYFSLAQTARTLEGAESNLVGAAKTQQIVARDRPTVGSLSTLAIYEYFSGDFAAGDKAAKQAQQHAVSKQAAKTVNSQLVSYRKRGKQFEKQKRQLVKEQKKKGKEALSNPLGGLSGSSIGP